MAAPKRKKGKEQLATPRQRTVMEVAFVGGFLSGRRIKMPLPLRPRYVAFDAQPLVLQVTDEYRSPHPDIYKLEEDIDGTPIYVHSNKRRRKWNGTRLVNTDDA